MKYLALVSLLLFSACSTTISPPTLVEQERPEIFKHEALTRVLSENVNLEGRVDYENLRKDPKSLEQYYSYIASYSPDSTPELFPSTNHELAYWLNAYNAAVIRTVLAYYPIKSVKDVKPPAALFLLPELSGFFVFRKSVFGGEEIDLYALENKIIRKRYPDPRIHFALNCASIGCPVLPPFAFEGEVLEEQLEKETFKFFSAHRNLHVDKEAKKIRTSSILSWYEEDFGDLRSFLKRYAPAGVGVFLEDESYELEFVEYDWGLNDQAS